MILYQFHQAIDTLSALFRKKMHTAYWSIIIPALTEGYKIILSEDEELRSEYQSYRWLQYFEQVRKIKEINLTVIFFQI